MARHASAERQRRLAAWPIVVGVVLLVVAGLTVAYFLVVNTSRRTAACTGSTVLPVTASPGAGRAVGDAATAFNATAPVARSTCVTVSVSVLPGATAATALAAGWTDQKSSAPGLWVVDSAADVATLDAADSAMTAGHSNTPVATSPVVVAVRSAPPGPVSWPGLAAGSAGVILAVPDPADNRASGYGLQAMIATTAPTAAGLDAAAVTAAAPTLGALAAAVPVSPPTTEAGLDQLAAGTGGFTAVPVVESELAAFNTTHSPDLTAVYPTGPSAGDEIMAIPLTAGWVTEAMSDAAAAFDAFLGDPAGTAILTADHLRTSATPVTAAGVDLATPVTALPETAAAVSTAIDAAWTAAVAAAGAGQTATTVTGPPTDSGDPPTGTTPTTTTPPSSTGPSFPAFVITLPTSTPPTSTPSSSTPPTSTPSGATPTGFTQTG